MLSVRRSFGVDAALTRVQDGSQCAAWDKCSNRWLQAAAWKTSPASAFKTERWHIYIGHKVYFVASTLLDTVRRVDTKPASEARPMLILLCRSLPNWSLTTFYREFPEYLIRNRMKLFVRLSTHTKNVLQPRQRKGSCDGAFDRCEIAVVIKQNICTCVTSSA